MMGAAVLAAGAQVDQQGEFITQGGEILQVGLDFLQLAVGESAHFLAAVLGIFTQGKQILDFRQTEIHFLRALDEAQAGDVLVASAPSP